MKWPHGAQWEWALGEFVVLGFLFWELYSLRRTKRRDREKAQNSDPALGIQPLGTQPSAGSEQAPGGTGPPAA
ncbi:hypothetical protein [Rhodopila sp.]|uniref:hypothetical protein n=1 Tax=Rhodopila sp. TaxID=2480087 RepID=UPI003D0B06C6